ncbi:MAG: OmpA family protein [Alphaproteobacteria bacterium]|nr:OmpA family protein [Alphaproteobacteria bacterium]
MRGPRALVGIPLILAAGFAAVSATSPSWAQVPYRIGDGNPNVTVDLSVLDALGTVPTIPQMLHPGLSSNVLTPSRSGAPVAMGAPTNAAPAWLRRPDAPVYAAPPAALMTRAAPAPAAPKTMTLAPPKPMVAKPAAPQVVTATPVAPKPTTMKPAAPPPPPVIPKAPEPPKLPPPAIAAPKRATDTQVAAVPPAPAKATSAPAAPTASTQGVSGDQLRLVFPAEQSQLPDDAKSGLNEIIARLQKNEALRVQLLAYADGDQGTANKARRLSLSRALAVRAYLIDAKIQSTRMDVRALGNRAQEAPKDRVDVVLVSR